jgi:hypothetical protein
MAKPTGRTLAITPFRQVVIDLMHFSDKVPSVVMERRINLAPVIAARRLLDPHPGWCGMIARAFGMLGRDYPVLRRCYLSYPWPHFYEHPHSVATLNVERQLPDEDVVLYAHIRAPENRTLAEIDALVRHHKEAPIDQVRTYRRSLAMARIPWPLRRFVWWWSLNVRGKVRCHNFGTFGISSTATQGGGLLSLNPILTATLHFGLFDRDGSMDMRLSWDHRVFDGGTAARVLVDLEDVMNRVITAELGAMRRAAA